MKTLSSDRRVRRLAADAALLGLALILSFVEAVLPLDLLPIPGFRLGLPNLAITVAAFLFGPADAVFVSAGRILITYLLFANPVSFVFSASGGALVLLGLFVLTRLRRHPFSFFGVSILCATLHNGGQLIAASVLFGGAAVGYAPFLLLASVLCGALTGLLLNLTGERIFRARIQREGAA